MKYAIYFTWAEDNEKDSVKEDNAKKRDRTIKYMKKVGWFKDIRYCPIYKNGEYGQTKEA